MYTFWLRGQGKGLLKIFQLVILVRERAEITINQEFNPSQAQMSSLMFFRPGMSLGGIGTHHN